jgi:hypothetical protein
MPRLRLPPGGGVSDTVSEANILTKTGIALQHCSTKTVDLFIIFLTMFALRAPL